MPNIVVTPEENARLNGTEDEFPHRQEAMDSYRQLWGRYVLSQDEEEKRELEMGMDEQQVRISHGPGSVWRDFASSLPGFNAWWARSVKEMLEEHARRKEA